MGYWPCVRSKWLLERSKMINLQMLIQKNTFNVIGSCCPFKKTCSGMSASVFFGMDAILAHAKAWDLVLWKCPRRSTTLRSAPTFYTSTERLTRLKLLKCAFTQTRMFERDVLLLFLRDLFIILSRFLAVSCSVKMLQAFHNPSINLHRAWER